MTTKARLRQGANPKPTKLEQKWINLIARDGPLMKTYLGERKHEAHYSLGGSGKPVPYLIARGLITKSMLVPQKDGMWDDCQTWRAKTPADV